MTLFSLRVVFSLLLWKIVSSNTPVVVFPLAGGEGLVGGDGGNSFENYCSDGVYKISFFDGSSGVVRGIRFTCYNGDHYQMGLMVGLEMEYTFAIGELISGDITIIGNDIGTQMGGIKFNTNLKNIQFPENWPSDRDNYIFPADSSTLLGFWGRAGSDINALGLVLSPPSQSLPKTRVAVGMRRSSNGEPEVKATSTDTEGDTSEDSTDNTEHNTLAARNEVNAITNDVSQDTNTEAPPPTTPPPMTVPVWATALAASLSFLAGIALTLIVGIFLVRRAKSKTYVFGPDNTAPLVKSLLV